jgi:hypothetical protein
LIYDPRNDTPHEEHIMAKSREGGGCTRIIIAIIGAAGTIIAAIIGGPLLEEIIDYFENNSAPSIPAPTVEEGGPLFLTPTANPNVISPGQWTTINVLVISDQGVPVSDANVTIEAGGGVFQKSGTSTAAGQTDNSGVFRVKWKCDSCAASYEMTARATKLHFDAGQAPVTVYIQ